ncbi:MAG TPA: sigma-70 family RNA polymerase sigma factor [Tepidisphaeraceae bacterium]|nr:sigma-70 family RNA polymerase sigma factor [Tepidisphaeraceae bacterium]
MRRYAGMVFNVCYQILRDSHDAEDAAQAVFLTLAVKSKTENGIKYLAPWLQKVAQRLALDVKRSKTRRKVREERHSVMQQMNAGDGDTSAIVDLDEVKVVLRDELDKLPAKYRLPLILHYFGGLRPEEMARELGCKPSTLGVRLHRGRKLLAENLAGRGVSIGGSMLGIALATVIQSSVQEHLIHRTSYAAMQMAAGHTSGAGLSAQVMGFNRLAEQGLLMAKIKAAVTAAALLATAAAGAAEFVARVKPFGMEMNLPGIRSLFDPIIRTFSRNLHVPVVSTQQPAKTIVPAKPDSTPNNTNIQSFAVSEPSQPAPLQAVSSTDGGAGASHPTAAVQKPSAVASNNSSFTLSPIVLSQPTIHWPISTPSEKSAALAAVGDHSTDSPASSSSTPLPQPIAASDSSVVIGGAFGSHQSYTWSGGPNPINVRKFSVGVDGFGDFHQTGGVVQTDHLSLGEDKDGSGTYVVSGTASIQAGTVIVGDAGSGNLVINSASASLNAGAVYAAMQPGSKGLIQFSDGTITDNLVAIGVQGDGTFTQTGGDHTIDSANGIPSLTSNDALRNSNGLVLALANGSSGLYSLQHGHVTASKEVVGANSAATLKQTGGLNTTNSVRIGAAAGANGIYKQAGGVLNVTRGGVKHTGVIVGDRGSGALALGDENSTGSVQEIGSGEPVSMTVRQDPIGQGRLYGWGNVNLHGTLNQNGVVIADGYGFDRDLNLSSFAKVINTIPNPPGQDNGFFARHGGRLVLPPVDITGADPTVTWGENPTDEKLELINSARFSFTGVTNPGDRSINLLAPDRMDIPPTPGGVKFASIWNGDFNDLGATAMDVTLRYDDTFSPGIAAGNVQLWTSNGIIWQPVNFGASVDVTQRLITASIAPTDWLAVSTVSSNVLFPQSLTTTYVTSSPILGVNVPEPASLGLIAMGAATFLTRRRRRDR